MTSEKKSGKKKPVARGEKPEESDQHQFLVVESKKRQLILEGRIKASYCEGCEGITEKVFVGEWKPSNKPKEHDLLDAPDAEKKRGKNSRSDGKKDAPSAAENQYWIRCAACNQVHLLKEWQIQIDKELNLNELKPGDCQLYTPYGIYAEGDAVYHEPLEEVGVVREKNSTGSGTHVIIVEFITSGRKQLLENVQIGQNKPGQNESVKDILKMKLKR